MPPQAETTWYMLFAREAWSSAMYVPHVPLAPSAGKPGPEQPAMPRALDTDSPHQYDAALRAELTPVPFGPRGGASERLVNGPIAMALRKMGFGTRWILAPAFERCQQ